MGAGDNGFDSICDWRYGFNLDSRSKESVGYLLTWSGCGGLSLSKDIQVWNPFESSGQTIVSGSTIKCIGILESFHFNGGTEDPIRIVAYVSKEAAADIRAKLTQPISTTKIDVAWYIIGYDDDTKKWYEAAFVHDGDKAKANVDNVKGELQMFISTSPTRISDTLDVRVYRFEFQVVPAKSSTTTLEFASGSTQKLVKQWGSGS